MKKIHMFLLVVIVVFAFAAGIFAAKFYTASSSIDAPVTDNTIQDNPIDTSQTTSLQEILLESDRYKLSLLVDNSFSVQKVNPNYEFILTSKSYPGLKFYLESDFNPGECETCQKSETEINNTKGQQFNIIKFIDKSTALYRISAAEDKYFVVAATAEQDSVENEKAVYEVISNLSFELKSK